MPLYDIFTIAAAEKHARKCGIPVMLRGSVQAPDAQSALANFPCSRYVNDDGYTLADYAHIPFADYHDTAVGYEDADPHQPIVWLATYHRP